VKVEEAHKETQLALGGLSPQLQVLIGMEVKQKELEQRLQGTEERDDDWRQWINDTFNKAVKASKTNDYRTLRLETYEILEERAHCNLRVRLSNLKQRLSESGATKTKQNAASLLDVIEGDVKLKEIYSAIIKEFAVRYTA